MTESKETYDDILRIFKERYNIDEINDFRPAPFDFLDSRKAGIKVWFDNGDEIIFIPKEWKELNEERLKICPITNLISVTIHPFVQKLRDWKKI